MKQSATGTLSAVIAAITALILPSSSTFAQGEFERLMWLVPETTNALALVRSKALFETPIALKDGWDEEKKAASGPLSNLNPEADFTILASKVDWADGMKPDWEMALVALSSPVTADAIAESEAGTVDSADSLPLVWSPRELFYVPFGPQTIGIYSPVDRQGVLRWATSAKSRSDAVVSDYLLRRSEGVPGG